MSTNPHATAREDSPCPKCRQNGHPVSVTSNGPDAVIVEYRCNTCHEQWQERRVSPTIGRRHPTTSN